MIYSIHLIVCTVYMASKHNDWLGMNKMQTDILLQDNVLFENILL